MTIHQFIFTKYWERFHQNINLIVFSGENKQTETAFNESEVLKRRLATNQ